VLAGTPWLDVFCPGCRTSRAIDLRTVDRHRAPGAPGSAPMPKLLGLYAPCRQPIARVSLCEVVQRPFLCEGGHAELASPTPLDGALDAVVRAEIRAPSAIAQDELSTGRRPPCAKAASALVRPGNDPDFAVHEDLSRRRRLLCREAMAFH
jgi:hypothetical protein